MQVSSNKKVYGVQLDWNPTRQKKGQDFAGYGNMTRFVTFAAAEDRSDFGRELKKAIRRQLEDHDVRNYKVVGSEVIGDAAIVMQASMPRLFRKGAVA